MAIVKLLQCEDFKIDDLLRLSQSDPAIAGNLLKFSNASSFGHSHPIVSLSKAITTLGAFRVRNLVLALSVLHNHRSGDCPQFDYGWFGSRSLASAISAQALASYARTAPEENFTAGLLSCVGELALASIFPERYGEILSASDQASHKRLELEHEAFGTDHRELTATLLVEWGFPEIFVSAVYYCEAPAAMLEGSRNLGPTYSLHKERKGLAASAGEWAETNRRLIHVAMTDPLTQLPNRRHGLDTFSAERYFARTNNLPPACLKIDIDHFRNINDRYGHKAGDAALARLSIPLQTGARNEYPVFRYGGEEFCIICQGAVLEWHIL